MLNEDGELDIEKIDQLARKYWQNDLAKFFPKQKEPNYSEYKMFYEGYKAAFEESLRLRTALNQIVSILDCAPKDKEHSSILNDAAFGVARAALENE